MAMKKAPAFQFYPKDFLSDGKQASMTNAEAGVYTRLLCVCWLEGWIPDDVTRAGLIVGETPASMGRMWPAVRACFTRAGRGRLRHKRLDAEREKQAERSRVQSENGKHGGRPKKANGKPSLTQSATQAKAKKSSSSPSPVQSKNPPSPPAAAGGKFTRRELTEARKDLDAFLARQPRYQGPIYSRPKDFPDAKRCPHTPECDDRAVCLTLLALARRAKVQSVVTTFGVGVES